MKVIGKTVTEMSDGLIVEMTCEEWQACSRLGELSVEDETSIRLVAERVGKYTQMRRDLVQLAKVLGYSLVELPPEPTKR